jgi:quercetin dioxygenase-like cupin family protein
MVRSVLQKTLGVDVVRFTMSNWNDLIREKVRPGVERVGFGGENMIAVMNWLSPGMEVRPHSHPFEQLVIIIEGQIRLHVAEDVVLMGPGDMAHIPPDVTHYAEPVGDRVAINLDIFAPIRDDYQHLLDHQRREFL